MWSTIPRNKLRPILRSLAMLILGLAVYFALEYLIDLPPSGLEFRSETITVNPKGDSITFQCEFLFHPGHPRKTHYELAFPTHESGQLPPPTDVEVSVDGREV